MKKSLIILSVLILIFSFVGCSANPSTDDPTNATGNQQTGKPAITDYTIEGVTNVTGVSINKNNSINVDVMCPHCEKETFDIIEFSEISEDLLGQQTFTMSGEIRCMNWENHSNDAEPSFEYSVLFTLNG